MNSKRNVYIGIIAFVAFLLVIAAVFAQILSSNSQVTAGYVAVHAVAAGTKLGPQDIQLVQVKQGGNFNFLADNPLGKTAVHPLQTGDLIRTDDVESASFAQVSLNVSSNPGIGPGSYIDVYSNFGAHTILLGRHLLVVGGAGSNPVIQVPAAQAPAWLSIASSGRPLIADTVLDESSKGVINIDQQSALSQLSGLSPTDLANAATATSPATPTATP